MKYKKLGRTPFEVSQIGIGCRGFMGMDLDGMKMAVNIMLELGINLVDLFSTNPDFKQIMGRALMNNRGNFILQAHIGAIWKNGDFHYTRKLKQAEKAFSDQLRTLATGHAEIGLIHNVESPEDLDVILNGDIMKFAEKLKSIGSIWTIGMSIHDAKTALLAAKSGAVDTIMFDANVYTDRLDDDGKLADEINPIRTELYDYCAKNGIGLTIMNVYEKGDLRTEASPLGQPLSVQECIAYTLSTPGVASGLCSTLNANDLRDACKYLELSPKKQKELAEKVRAIR